MELRSCNWGVDLGKEVTGSRKEGLGELVGKWAYVSLRRAEHNLSLALGAFARQGPTQQ